MAALVLWVRNAGEQHFPDEGPAPATLVETMIATLEKDPPMDQPATVEAVRRVAQLAADSKLSSPEAFYALGLWHTENKRFEAAEEAFRKCIEMRPQWSWPRNALGIVLGNHSENRLTEAEAEFRAAIRLDPDWSRPHNDLAILLRLAGRFEEAEKEALLAIQLDPENVATHNNYGNLLVATMQLEKAEAEYLKAIEIDPRHPKPYYNLACVYALSGQKEKALSLLEKAVVLNPELRSDALTDPDLKSLHNENRFRSITQADS